MDGQSLSGKAPITLAKLAKSKGKKVLAFCGCIGENIEKCNEYIDGVFCIQVGAVSLEKAMDVEYASNNLFTVSNQVFRLM